MPWDRVCQLTSENAVHIRLNIDALPGAAWPLVLRRAERPDLPRAKTLTVLKRLVIGRDWPEE